MTRAYRAPRALGLAALGALVLAGSVQAAMEVTAPNGRRVMLKDDHTWEYLAGDGSDTRVKLQVVKRVELPNACRFGLRLTNNANVRIQSLVPQFSVFNRADVPFETVFAAFTQIKPTQDQYQEITFRGIRCEDIGRVTVHGADRCSVGDLTKFSPATGECLRYIEVEPSDLVSISK
ncbi:MAG: DUF3157 family protein [Gammaproteobacteria bacterium]|jgi:hypothetical protein|nr:DUF3157 family protein [Gammaproteobacteria bacterium]